VADGVDFVTRSTSLYVEVPGGLVFQVQPWAVESLRRRVVYLIGESPGRVY
jgi:hypothetical protein